MLGFPVFHLILSQSGVCAGIPGGGDIYMRLPQGSGKRLGRIVKLLKCQYGLEQVGRAECRGISENLTAVKI